MKLVAKQQIILRHINNESNRSIAQELGIDKNTVNKYVNEYEKERKELLESEPDVDPAILLDSIIEKPTYNTENRKPRESTEEVRKVIKVCLDENEEKRRTGRTKQQQRATDIHGYLTDTLGYSISYSTVRNIVNELENKVKEAFIRQEYQPGQACEFDWGEVKLNIGGTGYRKYQMAAFASSYGNYRFARLYRTQDTAAFQESHVSFFRFCHGVYKTVVYDNMKVAVREFVGPTEKEPTEALAQMSLYYGFNFRFCNVRSGNEKPHVERSVDVIRHFAFCAPGDDCFNTLEEANAHLLKKCREKNNKALSDGRIPAETFAEEVPYLMRELPAMPCFIRKTNLKVNKYSVVTVNNVKYSVPDIYTGKRVDARVYTGRIVIYHGSEKIAVHERFYENGSYHLDIYHYLRTLKRKPGALSQSTALLQADTAVKTIYEKYYSKDAKTFLQILEIIKIAGANPVKEAIEELLRISPLDLSAEKVKAIYSRREAEKENENNSITRKACSQLGDRIKGTLIQYDRLLEAMNPERRQAAC